ncbi:MAG: hypothetical protein IJ409_01090 [Lachnospiraceae bacterium]|nr:hypothetical protein [Lachnospiraceae bacterium]
MKYENAKDLLPPELLSEVQKYAAGKLIYVPIAEEAKGWGTISGYRQRLLKRNQTIYNEYVSGKTVSELADEYFLSTDSIKKIVYGKRSDFIPFEPTTCCAVKYSDAGFAEEWIRAFCVSRQPQIVPLLQNYIHFGIVKMPLRLVEMPAVCGKVEKTQSPEPLLVHYAKGKFYLLGQENLFLSLKEERVNAYPVFILITDRSEYQAFMKNFGKHFMQAKI